MDKTLLASIEKQIKERVRQQIVDRTVQEALDDEKTKDIVATRVREFKQEIIDYIVRYYKV